MALFGKKRAPVPLLTATVGDLEHIGRTAFGGESTYPPGVGGLAPGALDAFAMASLERGDYPMGDPVRWERYLDTLLSELDALSASAGPWAQIGAWPLAWNLVTEAQHRDPRYLAIVDRALVELRNDGVTYTAVPPTGLERWHEVHGRDGLRPKGWPSPLEHLTVPDPASLPPTTAPAPGEVRRVAERVINGAPNYTEVEWRPEAGRFQAVIDGVDAADGVRKRWDLEQVAEPTYDAFLVALGELLVTPTIWAHDDLVPYFPCRMKSRDELRIEARSSPIGAP